MYPDGSDAHNIVTYDPKSRKVTFKNLMQRRYLIIAPANSSIISMFGYENRSLEIKMSSKRIIQVLPIDSRPFLTKRRTTEKSITSDRGSQFADT